MTKSTCIVGGCGSAATRMLDPDDGKLLLCAADYQRWWKDRKENGEGALVQAALNVPCRCGCGKLVAVTGARRRKYEEQGILPFSSYACRDGEGALMKVPCSGCGTELERYRVAVERSKTGRFICPTCRENGVGCKPRKGKLHTCQGCGIGFYRRPSDTTALFHDAACRQAYEKAQRITLTCEGCGTPFEVWKSVAERGRQYHNNACRSLSQITNRVPGQWHNGKPKRYDGQQGYVLIYEPDHPNASRYGWVAEHRWVVEQSLGRHLATAEEVNHINEVKDDNSLENLEVLSKPSHSSVTGRSNWAKRKARDAELEEYRRQFGPLPKEAS